MKDWRIEFALNTCRKISWHLFDPKSWRELAESGLSDVDSHASKGHSTEVRTLEQMRKGRVTDITVERQRERTFQGDAQFQMVPWDQLMPLTDGTRSKAYAILPGNVPERGGEVHHVESI
jgi:hypothetical protein